MKKALFILSLLSLISFTNLNAQNNSNSSFRNRTSSDYFPGKIIFKVKSQYRTSCKSNGVDFATINETLERIHVSKINKKFPNHQPPLEARNAQGNVLVDLSTIYEAEFDPQFQLGKAIQLLMASGKLEYAEPVYKMQLLFNPNDPDTALQYYLGLIRAYEAWDINQGDSSIVVGVTDTGTDLDHPDLANGIAYNYADPINGIDDDGDGFVDNFMGWDLGQNDNDPSVDVIHGSFVSGLAGAVTNNGVGIAGTGYKSRFLPVKISNNGVLTVAYDGIVYAADHGCQIINCSWGGFGGGQFGQDIVDYATFNKNSLVVGASGNSNNDAPFFPASYKNVLSVTGTNNTDTKWVNSSFGSFVDISAPGEAIYSTTYDNAYLVSSGTSFAAPIVAAAAALVKSQFPNYGPLQIAEQLRATADDIYSVPGNANYFHQLGKGRLDVFRALTESPKSVRMNDYYITDNNDNAFAGNDTLDITTYLTNYLAPVLNLSVMLTSDNPDINIISNTVNPGLLNTLATYDNSATPFRAVIGSNIPYNTKVTFTLTFTDGAYVDWQTFELVVNVDYINVQVNDVGTSITSKGRIGYNIAQAQGIGFTYNDGASIMYEGGLMIGTDTAKVSDHLFGTPVSVLLDDFYSMVNVRKIIPSVHSDFDLDSRFNDDGAGTNSLNVEINQRSFAWSSPADSKYVIVEYIISNMGTNQLSDFYAGLYADWDIGNVTDNRAEYDANLKLGYAYNTASAPVLYAGIKQLTTGNNNFYALDNNGTGATINIYDGFTKTEKYQSLSSARLSAGQSGVGNDISMTLSSGPYTIPSGDSIRIAFALLAGEDLASLQASAVAAEIKYTTLNSIETPVSLIAGLSQNFPNPFSVSTTLNYTVSGNDLVKIEIFDVLGNKVRTLVNDVLSVGKYEVKFPANGLADGIYFCRMINGDLNQVVRMIKMD